MKLKEGMEVNKHMHYFEFLEAYRHSDDGKLKDLLNSLEDSKGSKWGNQEEMNLRVANFLMNASSKLDKPSQHRLKDLLVKVTIHNIKRKYINTL